MLSQPKIHSSYFGLFLKHAFVKFNLVKNGKKKYYFAKVQVNRQTKKIVFPEIDHFNLFLGNYKCSHNVNPPISPPALLYQTLKSRAGGDTGAPPALLCINVWQRLVE